jgi:tRNA-specific 2-thiouridylase
VQIRYSHGGSSALLQPHGTEAVSIRFDEPQEAATPGQAAVFRRGDALLGGGTIHEVAGQETAA